MSSRMFQGVLLQLSEAAQTTIGVIDAEGNVISCSDTTLIGEKWPDAATAVAAMLENPVREEPYTFYALKGWNPAYGYSAFVLGTDAQAEMLVRMTQVSLNSAKAYYEEKHDKGTFVKNIITDNILPGDIYIRAKELHFPTELPRAVYLVRQVGRSDVAVVELLQSMYPDTQQDFVINVPPLRECKEDILSLAEFFIQRSNKKLNKAVNGFDASARKALLAYPWPGNVRELQQKVQSAVLLAKSDMITIHELELHLRQTPQSFSYALKDEKGEQERIRLALEKVDWNLKETAKLLDISRTTLYKKLKDYNLTRNTKQE